jgi:hypothetical protein
MTNRIISVNSVWLLLVFVQIVCVVFFMHNQSTHGLFNPDAFSYHVQWSKVAYTANPFTEAILADPSHDLVRLPFSMPHFLIGVVSAVTGPEIAYLFWSCIGVLTTYFSLFLFASALGFENKHAALVAVVHYTFSHVISQLPPLSGNQLSFVFDAFRLSGESILHFGPRQYPHDIFFYPLLYTLLSLTLNGLNLLRSNEQIPTRFLLLWGALCLILPLNYFYHWFQYGFVLVFIIGISVLLKWVHVPLLFKTHKNVLIVLGFVLVWWTAALLFQNTQLADQEGYRFALMGGLTEARFTLLPMGFILRAALWSILILILLRFDARSVLLAGFLFGCVVLMNMQVIAGKNIQPGHWTFGADKIFAWIQILIIARVVKKYLRRWQGQIRGVALVISIVFFALFSFSSWKYFERMSRWDDDRVELITFLREMPQSVILAPELWIDTDILIHTHHFSFLPRGAQSAVSINEQLDRLTHAALILRYSKEGFIQWLHTRSVRFFGMMYGTRKEFSSSLYYNSSTQPDVIQFDEGGLADQDAEIIENYIRSDSYVSKRLDLIVIYRDEPKPFAGKVIFENEKFIVLEAAELKSKAWGSERPIGERKYPLLLNN